MAEGWIKIHRSIMDKGFFKKPEYVLLWLYLLLLANHREREFLWNGKSIRLKPGQLITGRKSLSEKTGISESSIQRALKFFEIEQQIEQQTTSTSRLISILNWEKYQDIEQRFGQRLDSGWTASEQRLNTPKELKNEKNEKNEKNISIVFPSFNDFWELYQKKVSRQKCEKKWQQLTQAEKEKIIDFLPGYIQYTPDVQYRKDPTTFLNNRTWEDELPVKKIIAKNEQLANLLRTADEFDQSNH